MSVVKSIVHTQGEFADLQDQIRTALSEFFDV